MPWQLQGTRLVFQCLLKSSRSDCPEVCKKGSKMPPTWCDRVAKRVLRSCNGSYRHKTCVPMPAQEIPVRLPRSAYSKMPPTWRNKVAQRVSKSCTGNYKAHDLCSNACSRALGPNSPTDDSEIRIHSLKDRPRNPKDHLKQSQRRGAGGKYLENRKWFHLLFVKAF